MNVKVVYDRCYSGVAKEVVATASGYSWYPDTFDVEIQEIFTWGFIAYVYRIDILYSNWVQRGVEMQWKAFFGKICVKYFLIFYHF